MTRSISFLGAAEGVTGSRHLLSVGDTKILVDCGLFQGRRKEAEERNRDFRIDARGLHSVVLTHGHIDHSGALPILVRNGFQGNIFATSATTDLAQVMLRDSGHIHEKDAEYLNRRREKEARLTGRPPEGPPIEPLYTVADAERCDASFAPIPYHATVPIGPGITMSFTDQGHILGAGAALVTVEGHGEPLRIVFSGDRGRRGMPILRDPEPYPECDVLLTESTYGNRVHESVDDMEQALETVVRRILRTAGKVVIPAFSVGRTQNILYHLHRLILAGRLPRLPIFVDSPLSSRATEVYARHPECFDRETMEFLRKEVNPFEFEGLRYVESVEESIELNQRSGPFVVLSASGMCETGRILHHLKHAVEDERNVVLLVGWMAENTLGRRLRDGAERVKIYGRPYRVRARIETMNGFSAHGDREDLLHSVSHLVGRVKTILLIHGERAQSEPLREAMLAQGHRDVRIAELFSTVSI